MRGVRSWLKRRWLEVELPKFPVLYGLTIALNRKVYATHSKRKCGWGSSEARFRDCNAYNHKNQETLRHFKKQSVSMINTLELNSRIVALSALLQD